MDKVSSVEAKAKIDPRIGPIQGVQPNPNANPIVYGNKMFCDFLASNLFSKFKYPIFINPINCNEKIIIIFSLQLLEIINIKFLNYEKKYYTNKSSKPLFTFVVGMAFGFGWTPCIGPILGSILALASTEENILKAIVLLSFYSLGLAIPFILSGFLIQKFLLFSKNFKKNINMVSKVGGIILLITGFLIVTNQLQILGYYILNIFPFFQNFG